MHTRFFLSPPFSIKVSRLRNKTHSGEEEKGTSQGPWFLSLNTHARARTLRYKMNWLFKILIMFEWGGARIRTYIYLHRRVLHLHQCVCCPGGTGINNFLDARREIVRAIFTWPAGQLKGGGGGWSIASGSASIAANYARAAIFRAAWVIREASEITGFDPRDVVFQIVARSALWLSFLAPLSILRKLVHENFCVGWWDFEKWLDFGTAIKISNCIEDIVYNCKGLKLEFLFL